MTLALPVPPVGLRPPYATDRAKLAPTINGSPRRNGGPFCTLIEGPVWTPIDTLWLDLSVNTLMTLPRTRLLRTWFLFDADRGSRLDAD